MTPAQPAPTISWRAYGRLWVHVKPYTARMAVVIAVSLAATCLGLVQPYVSKLLIDEALLKHDMDALVWISALLFGATVVGFALNIVASYGYVRLSAAMLFDMRLALFRHLQTLSPRFYAKFRLGDIMSRLNNDISEVQRVSADTALAILSNAVFLAGSTGIMIWLHWKLFLLSVAVLPISVYAFSRFQRQLTALTRQMRERSADLGSLFADTVLGMRVVISLNAAEHEAQRFRERNGRFIDTMLRTQMVSFLSGAVPGTLLAASTAGVFLYGGSLLFNGELTVGALVAFMAYHSRLMSPIQNTMGLAANLATARVSLSRIFELLDTKAEVEGQASAGDLSAVRQSVRFEGVSMRHDRAEILTDVSFEIPAGSLCAVVGASGSGKSTIADLLVRYLDPDAGRVLLDGRDIRDFSLTSLRSEAILVDQAPFLFNETIEENIAYGMPRLTRADIEAAGRAAGLDELIARLPEGYATRTGERGLAMSAGERQRIALARALVRRPSLLILDEPTSALDAELERVVAEGVREYMRGGTIIAITHRSLLADQADIVISIEGGRIKAHDAAGCAA